VKWIEQGSLTGFLFYKNNQQYQIMTSSKFNVVIKIWKFALRNLVIVTDFRSIYRYEKTVGEGSFAKVYQIVRLSDNKKFAAKALKKKKMKTEKDIKGLVSEIQILKLLGKHPTQLSLQEVHEVDNYVYIVLELAEGGQLFDQLRYYGKFSEQKSKIMMLQIIKSLKYIHQKGIMHRDLNFENILLDESDCLEQLKVIDFGLSKMINEN